MPYRLPTPELETQEHHIRSVRPSRLRVDSLWALAMRQIGIDNERATDLIVQARTVADKIGYETGIALCDIATAVLALDKNDTEKAVILVQEIEAFDIEDEHIQGWTTLIHAIVAYREFKPLDAMQQALRAYDDLSLVADIVGMGKALMMLGLGFSTLNDPTTALAYHIEHYHLTAPLEDAALSLVPLSQIVETALFLERTEAVAPYIEQGVAFSHTLAKENDTYFANDMAARFAGYDVRMAESLIPSDTHLESIKPFPDRAHRDMLLPFQQLLIRAQREGEIRRVEAANFALEPLSEHMEQHLLRMKSLLERDTLTGLYHHGYGDETLPLLLADARRNSTSLTLLFVDIDYFTRVNESHGYFTAEKVLHRLGTLLIETVNAPSIPIRYGGDRFVVVFPGYDSVGAYALADHLRHTIAQTTWTIDGVLVGPLTISGGLATHQDGEAAEILLKRANEALARAKQEGRNRIEIA